MYDSRYRPCRLSLQKERSLIRHALAVGQARIVFIVTYSPFTLKFFHLFYIHFKKLEKHISRQITRNDGFSYVDFLENLYLSTKKQVQILDRIDLLFVVSKCIIFLLLSFIPLHSFFVVIF